MWPNPLELNRAVPLGFKRVKRCAHFGNFPVSSPVLHHRIDKMTKEEAGFEVAKQMVHDQFSTAKFQNAYSNPMAIAYPNPNMTFKHSKCRGPGPIFPD